MLGEIAVAGVIAGCLVYFCYYREYAQEKKRFKEVNKTNMKKEKHKECSNNVINSDYGGPIDIENGIVRDVNS